VLLKYIVPLFTPKHRITGTDLAGLASANAVMCALLFLVACDMCGFTLDAGVLIALVAGTFAFSTRTMSALRWASMTRATGAKRSRVRSRMRMGDVRPIYMDSVGTADMKTCGLLSADNRKVVVAGVGNYTGDWVITAYDPVSGSILCHRLGKKLLDRTVPNTASMTYQVFTVEGQQSMNVGSAATKSGMGMLFGVFAREALDVAGQIADSEAGVAHCPS